MAFPVLSDEMMKKALALDFGAMASFVVASIVNVGWVQFIFVVLSVLLIVIRIIDGIEKVKAQRIKNEYDKQKALQEKERHQIDILTQQAINDSITASSHEALLENIRNLTQDIESLKGKKD